MKQLIIITLFSFLISLQSYAQGCSDAGFCTINALKGDLKKTNSLALSTAISSGENGTSIITPQLELKKSVGMKGVVEMRLPFNIASGDAGSHSGIGDLMATYTRPIIKKMSVNATIGTKISLGNATATDGGQPLPMPYQSNLGTTDIIIGVSAKWKKYVSAAIGYQQPVIQYNDNAYTKTASTYNTYFESANLERSGDVLVRAQGHFDRSNWGISAGPLLIYHLADDKITYPNGVTASVTGSQGATLNLAGNVYVKVKSWQIDISAGSPFMVRTARPDGLTKSWTVIPRLTYNFNKKK